MKRKLTLLLAAIMCLSVVSCGETNDSTTKESESTSAEIITEAIHETEAVDLIGQVIPSELGGVWLSDNNENILTFYYFEDNKTTTYVVNSGKGLQTFFPAHIASMTRKSTIILKVLQDSLTIHTPITS